MKTWHYETAFVALVLFLVTFFFKNTPIEYVGSLAVLLTFGHAQISERLAEREALRNLLYRLREEGIEKVVRKKDPLQVDCYKKMLYYFVGKELCWCVYFLTSKSYAALVGVVVFLLYPLWRRYWRKIKPLS